MHILHFKKTSSFTFSLFIDILLHNVQSRWVLIVLLCSEAMFIGFLGYIQSQDVADSMLML